MGRNTEITTLNSAQDLSRVSFGHKFPRHGLQLLHWLANNWILFDDDGEMWTTENPHTGKFGFHRFHNTERILPDLQNNSRYFEVGNMNIPGARALPFKQAEGQGDESNTDRIIVKTDYCQGVYQMIDKVYITEHIPHLKRFQAQATYGISKGLIKSLKCWTLSTFLQKAGYISTDSVTVMVQDGRKLPVDRLPRDDRPFSSDNVCSCVIL